VKGEWEERFESRFGFWRGFVDGSVARYLDCGIPENGFARVRCGDCRKDVLVAFSCKGWGMCPSCGAKRAAETAARLREDVLEPVGHAQWVFTVPKMLRPYFLRNRELFRRPVSCGLADRAGDDGRRGRSGDSAGNGGRGADLRIEDQFPSPRPRDREPRRVDEGGRVGPGGPALSCGLALRALQRLVPAGTRARWP